MAKMTLQVGANISGLKHAMGEAKSLVSEFAGGIAGGLGVAGLVAFGKSAIDSANEVYDGSKKLGLSAEEYQKLEYAAKHTGADMGDVGMAIKKMSGVVSDAMSTVASVSEPAIAKLAKLGLTVDDMKNKTPYERFVKMADAINGISDASDKAAMETDYFGKSGMNLNQLLSVYKDLGKELENIGGVMSEKDVLAAKEFDDALIQITTSLKNGFMKSGLVEYLQQAAEGFKEVVTSADKIKSLKGANGKGASGLYAEQGTSWYGRAAEFTGNYLTLGNYSRMTEKANEFGTGSNEVIRTSGWDKKDVDKALAEKAATKEQKKKSAAVMEEEKHREALTKALEEYDKEQKKLLEEGLKEQAAVEGSIAKLQEKIAIQKLINEGKEKEAAIQEAINEASSKGALTDEQRASITQAAGELFDLSQKADAGSKGVDMTPAQVTDSVARIGGSIGGAAAVDYQKDQLTTQKQIYEAVNNIKSGMLDPSKGLTGGGTWL